MSSLIPFESRAQASGEATRSTSPAAPIVDLSSRLGQPRSQVLARRRPRRNWDPEFHVDLLTF